MDRVLLKSNNCYQETESVPVMGPRTFHRLARGNS
jgi:hypothetical protein